MTKLQMENLRAELKFDCCFSVERCGMGGGLALLWNNDVNVDVRSFNKFHIDVLVKDSTVPSWRFTGFYGDLVTSKRGDSWVLLERLAKNCSIT